MQEVLLDKNVRLLDCPGIVMATGSEVSAHTILRNAVKVEQIEDPTAPVEVILTRCRKDQMMLHYKVRHCTDNSIPALYRFELPEFMVPIYILCAYQPFFSNSLINCINYY